MYWIMNKNVDELLLSRIRNTLVAKGTDWEEKRMFGGLCFMVDGKMCFGTYKGGMMARINPEEVDKLIENEAADQMIHGGRPMNGYLFIQPEGYETDEDLEYWIRACLAFNPFAKASKKKKKK